MDRKQVIADALSYNNFKKCWSARVSVMETTITGKLRCCAGCMIEGKTKSQVKTEAETALADIANQYDADPVNYL